jgi:hypothetical protein
MACGVVLCAQALVAQTTTQLFGPVDPAGSNPSANYSAPYAFNTATLNLTCTASPIQATLSGPGGGNLLVDNNIIVTVTPANEPAQAAVNVCPVTDVLGGAGLYYENCFNSTYANAAINGSILGMDPDTASIPGNSGGTIDAVGGVLPVSLVMPIVPVLDSSGSAGNVPTDPNAGSPVGLVSGAQSVTIALDDEGGEVASSSIFLNTNCILNGVSSGMISGNPITGSSGQKQTFTFNSNPGNGTPTNPSQIVSLTYDVSQVNPTTINNNGSTPQTTDAPVTQSEFQTAYVPGTSFATSNCLLHTGEVLPGTTTQACKLYTLECISPSTGLAAGANCPVSSELNEAVSDVFDGPQFALQNIYTPVGVFHEGIGLLMASDSWSSSSGGPCSFAEDAPGTPVANLPCPQNLLVSFSGPGIFAGKGLTTNPNSTFVSIAGVPEDHTSVVVAGQWPDNWVNNSTPKIYFNSQAPNLKGAYTLNGNKHVPLPAASSYIPAPIASITYGISPANSTLPVPASEPISTDNTVSSAACPTVLPSSPTEPNFATGPVSLQFPNEGQSAPLPDGQYLLHYFAQDCAGTQELQFTLNNINNVPTWSTNFYTVPLNIDTTPPKVNGLTITTAGAPYKIGQTLTATFNCSDLNTGAGVVLCGVNVYAPQTKYTTTDIGTLKLNFTANSTGKFTVYVADGAGNTNSATVTYTLKH